MKYKYFVPSAGETAEDAGLITKWKYNAAEQKNEEVEVECHDDEDAAEEAAEHYRDSGDTEWHEGTRRIGIVDQAGTISLFDVEIEWSPVFGAGRVLP